MDDRPDMGATGLRRVDEPVDVRAVGDVADLRPRLDSRFGQLADGRVEPRRIEVGEHDAVVAAEEARGREPDPAGATGDDRRADHVCGPGPRPGVVDVTHG